MGYFFATALAWTFLALLSACRVDAQQSLEADTIPFPLLKSTATIEAVNLTATWQASPLHPVLYIGPYRNPVPIRYDLGSLFGPNKKLGDNSPAKYAVVPDRAIRWKYVEDTSAYLAVDTTQLLVAEESLGRDLRTDTSSWFNAYPTLVRNSSQDTLWVGVGHTIPLALEAKDEQGQWQLIERPFRPFCATGLPIIFLPPKQLVITSVLIPHGPFKTDLRVKLGHNYSALFRGSISLRQFRSQFNAEGNYELEYVREHLLNTTSYKH